MPRLCDPTSSKDEVTSLMDKHASENADKPLYLAFFSTWEPICRDTGKTMHVTFDGPGKYMIPVMVAQKEEFDSADYAFRQAPFNITSVPTTVRYESGKEVSRIMGPDILDESKLSEFLKE